MQIDVESRVTPHSAPAQGQIWSGHGLFHEPTISLLVSRRVSSSLKAYTL
jgi:hypothetical protein